MRPKCDKCQGVLWSDRDPWGTLVVKCLLCGWQRSQHTSVAYSTLSVAESRGDGSRFVGRPRIKGTGRFVACRVLDCKTPVDTSYSSGLCRNCRTRKNDWEKTKRLSEPPFVVYPGDEAVKLPRLMWNPKKPRPGQGYGSRSVPHDQGMRVL